MPKLITNREVYDPSALVNWTKRRRNAVRLPATSSEFLRLLKRKRRGRSARTHRFFGEVFVASQIAHREAYYSSAKWLTNTRFAGSRNLPNPDHEAVRQALHRHFGQYRIQKLQSVVGELSRQCRRELRRTLPTAPDLWLVDKRGRHRFIEVKLPGDSVAPHQLAGMAAIASVLGSGAMVSVEVVELHDEQRLFKAFCRAIAG